MESKLLQYFVNSTRLQTQSGPLNPPMYKLNVDFQYLFADKSFADVELKIEDKILKAHKAILFSESRNVCLSI